MYRSDPNDPKFGNRGLEQSKCPVRDSLTEPKTTSCRTRRVVNPCSQFVTIGRKSYVGRIIKWTRSKKRKKKYEESLIYLIGKA